MTTRGRAKLVRKTGNTRPVVVGGICTPSAAARVGATSCCTAGVEYVPALTAGPANISGISTSYGHGEPCMNATSARVMKSPSRGTIRSWPVRPGKYARANILEETLPRRKSGSVDWCCTLAPGCVAPNALLDLLARYRPSHPDQGQGDSDPRSYFAHAST